MGKQRPPGWHVDPEFGEGKERWWDGSRYSGPTRPARANLVSASVRPSTRQQRSAAAGLDAVAALPAIAGTVVSLDQGLPFLFLGALSSAALFLLNSMRGGAMGSTVGKSIIGLAVVEERSGSPLGAQRGLLMALASLGLGLVTLGVYTIVSALRSLSLSSNGGPSQGLTERSFGAIVIAKKAI